MSEKRKVEVDDRYTTMEHPELLQSELGEIVELTEKFIRILNKKFPDRDFRKVDIWGVYEKYAVRRTFDINYGKHANDKEYMIVTSDIRIGCNHDLVMRWFKK